MASFHNTHKRQRFWGGVGTKVKHVAEIAGGIKGLYDTGRMLYNVAQHIGPVVAAAGVLL